MTGIADTVGDRLKAERERKGISAQKAADELHLDPWVIEALESGDFARIGPAVYGKGHLKRYAGLLGLPVQEIVGLYETRALPATAPTVASPTLRVHTAEAAAAPWLSAPVAGAVVLALIVFGLLAWRPWRPHPSPAATTAAPAPAPKAAPAVDENPAPGAARTEPSEVDRVAPDRVAPDRVAPDRVAPDRAPDLAAADHTPAEEHPPMAERSVTADRVIRAAARTALLGAPAAPAVSAALPAERPVGVGLARLRLSFSADSWVDVRDASGRRIFAGNGRANSVKSLAGAAPIRVYLGFASGVQLEVNSHVVAIGRQFMAGDVARFEAGADGVLRRDAHAPAPANPHPRG